MKYILIIFLPLSKYAHPYHVPSHKLYLSFDLFLSEQANQHKTEVKQQKHLKPVRQKLQKQIKS